MCAPFYFELESAGLIVNLDCVLAESVENGAVAFRTKENLARSYEESWRLEASRSGRKFTFAAKWELRHGMIGRVRALGRPLQREYWQSSRAWPRHKRLVRDSRLRRRGRRSFRSRWRRRGPAHGDDELLPHLEPVALQTIGLHDGLHRNPIALRNVKQRVTCLDHVDGWRGGISFRRRQGGRVGRR